MNPLDAKIVLLPMLLTYPTIRDDLFDYLSQHYSKLIALRKHASKLICFQSSLARN